MKTIESNLQQACVTWFRLQYPQHRLRLFAIPNGGQRSITTAKRLKSEGTTAGVWDLFLSIAYPTGYAGMFIEMKAPKGKLTESQQAFKEANQYAYAFAVCRSMEEFQQTIKEYLQ